MGQKINPLGVRLGVTQNHHSYWFAQPKKINSKLLQEDQKMRNCIKNYVHQHMRSSSNYELGNRREGQGYHLWLVMLT
jgi:small subunit ribosomal protein S3